MEFIKVTLELGGGEEQDVTLPEGATIASMRRSGFITGEGTVLLNGEPISRSREADCTVYGGNTVSVLPVSAKQGK